MPVAVREAELLWEGPLARGGGTLTSAAGEPPLKRALRDRSRIDTSRLECALYRLDDHPWHGPRLAAHFPGRGVGFDSLRAELRAADIVTSSTDAPHRIPRRAHIERVMASRRGRRLVIIDIAVPRDVEAATESLPDVTLYDIDDLEQVAEANRGGRRREAERAGGIIREYLSHFRMWHRAAATAPAVRALGRGRSRPVRASSPRSNSGRAH